MSGPVRSGERLIELDVVRGVALIGVCVMNYHGFFLIHGMGATDTGFAERVFDPWAGPLSTRFAATFVTLAGMSMSLLTRRSRASGDALAIGADRWKLVRRGVLLFCFGYFFDWVWPGTILFFYGAFFIVGALLVTWSDRWLAATGAAAAFGAAALAWWGVGHDAAWLTDGSAGTTRSPRDLLFDVWVRGTHPLLPWLAFVCLGIVLGRHLPISPRGRAAMAAAGTLMVATSYALRDHLPWAEPLRSTSPFSRSLVYVLSAGGSTLVGFVVVGAIAAATRRSPVTRALAAAGRTTLTLYVAHALVFDLLVDRLGWVHPSTLAGELTFALGFWVAAVAAAAAWARHHDLGPLEWVYRRFSE